jgi:hypothetical protein
MSDTNNRLTVEKLIELIDAVENPTRLLTSDGLIPLWVPFEDMTPEQQHACTRLEERVGVKTYGITSTVGSRMAASLTRPRQSHDQALFPRVTPSLSRDC